MDCLNALSQVNTESSMMMWIIIGVVIALILIGAIFVVSRKKTEALPSSEEKDALEAKLEGLSPEEYQKRKAELSLAEVKASKKTELADKSKEELRELRKDRRASEQTDKALKTQDEEEQESETESLKLGEMVTDSSVGAGDVFASLFGDSKKGSGLNFDLDDDIVGTKPSDSVIPTLGSGLIRLDGSKSGAADNSLDELTKRLAEKAKTEKKKLV